MEHTVPFVQTNRCTDEQTKKFSLETLGEHPDAARADVLALEVDDILRVVAKDAGRLIFTKNNGVVVYIDLQRVALRNIQRAAELDGENDSAQLIDFTYNPG